MKTLKYLANAVILALVLGSYNPALAEDKKPGTQSEHKHKDGEHKDHKGHKHDGHKDGDHHNHKKGDAHGHESKAEKPEVKAKTQ